MSTAHSELDTAIHTEDLTKVYSGTDFAAVDQLNLDVQAGEIFGLLGPNGAGKTTTAGMLTTRVVPTSGRALIAGVDVAAHPALAKQLSGIVSQQNTLDRQLTVWENLYFHGRLFGMGARVSRQTATDLLEQFQLSRWARASVYALSGGMAQRLMVARAIFHRPSVLFLDEPTAGLDPQSRLALWDLLGQLHAEGQTILLTTHYMEEADRLCQRVAIMDHGKILALDTPAALKQSTGADTIVTVRTTGDPARLAELLATDVEGVRRVHQPDRKGAEGRMTTSVTPQAAARRIGGGPTRSVAAASWTALGALLLRDLVVLRKHIWEFVLRTLIQPFLLCFVFLYVFPKIGQGIGGHGSTQQSAFATVLVPGVVGISVMFQGVQSIALAMAQEFGFTREIEDRVQAPCPIWLVAMAKVLSGAAQGILSAAIVLPIASVVHAPGVQAHLTLHWWLIVTFVPLSCVAMAGLGLVLGTSFEPRNIGLMFGFIILPITFLGGTYYSWTKLAPVTVGGWHWLQTIVLINPLIYVNEGMRAAFTAAPHMQLYVIYPVVAAFAAVFLAIGLRNFRRRVLS
jgi:ABC-2 type transport system permease protein